MKTQVDHGNPNTLPAAAGERLGADAVNSLAKQIGSNVASLDVAAADGMGTDVSLLGPDPLLELQLDFSASSQAPAEFSEPSFPSFHDDDLPAPLFHDDDLPAPAFHDDDLPAPLLHDHDLPADLTTASLSQLLGLEMSGDALPTVGEVVRTAFRSANTRETKPEDEENAEDDNSEDADGESEEPDAEPQETNLQVVEAGDLSFIDPETLTEKAETNNADAASGDPEVAEFLGLGAPLSQSQDEFDDDFDLSFDQSRAPPLSANGSEGASGSGTNVINGTAGDDTLNGTTGNDIIHGFAGNDVIDGGAGSDRLDGGLGDDVLVWDSADAKIDGKNGTDTLRVDGTDADLATFSGTLSGLEVIDMQTDGGANSLTLSAQDVLDATDTGDTLTVAGNSGDYLDASNGWTYGGIDGGGNHIYTQAVGPDTATLAVDPDISVNPNILM